MISNSPARPTWPIAVLHHTSKMATNKHFPSTVDRRNTANIAAKLRARPLKTSAPANARLLVVEAIFVTRVCSYQDQRCRDVHMRIDITGVFKFVTDFTVYH